MKLTLSAGCHHNYLPYKENNLKYVANSCEHMNDMYQISNVRSNIIWNVMEQSFMLLRRLWWFIYVRSYTEILRDL